MSLLEAIVLGVIQGLTEFIPVSSSGHLILANVVLGVSQPSLGFDVLLHVGTLVALLIYFWKELWQLFLGLLGKNDHQRLAWLLLMATIPLAVLGFWVAEVAETALRSVSVVAWALILVGILMIAAERQMSRRATSDSLIKIKRSQAVVVGLAQVVSLVPGVSRSGATITAGIFAGLDRVAATRFSFLLAIPATAGAALKVLVSGALTQAGLSFGVMIIGVLAAMISGWLAIGFLLRFLASRSLRAFAYYRICLGVLALLVL